MLIKKYLCFFILKIIASLYIFCKRIVRKKEKIYHYQKQIETNDIIHFITHTKIILPLKFSTSFNFFYARRTKKKLNPALIHLQITKEKIFHFNEQILLQNLFFFSSNVTSFIPFQYNFLCEKASNNTNYTYQTSPKNKKKRKIKRYSQTKLVLVKLVRDFSRVS